MAVRVATLNLASGRDVTGTSLTADDLAVAVAELDADVVSVQEVDVGQPRSHGVDQPAVLAEALGATDWRYAATCAGTPEPDPVRSWTPVEPIGLRGPGCDVRVLRYGVALFSRLPVRRWHVLGLGSGRAKLPVRAPDPRTGLVRTWWFPDEPRAAIAAEVDGLTVVGTHLSFAPHTATRQLYQLRSWARGLPTPVLIAGDLNLAGTWVEVVTGGRRLVSAPTFPAAEPWVQLDQMIALGTSVGSGQDVRRLDVGDHRAVTVTVAGPPG